jgi:hypothetical protein
MPIVATIPTNPNASRVRYPVRRFSAPFSLGQYDFNQAGNRNVVLMPLQSNSVYVITAINFFSNAREPDWLEGMGAQADFPAFRLHFENEDGNSIYPEPIQCVNFIDGGEQLSYFRTGRESENLLITFTGLVNQVAGMVGIDPLLAEVNFTIYQILDAKWIKKFINPEGA